MMRKGHSKPHLELLQQPSFAATALPLTMALARALRSVVAQQLRRFPAEWPFPDRLLVWLEPSFEKDVAQFHESRGPAMVELFKPWQVEHLDQDLVHLLARRANRLRPGVIALLTDIAADLEESED